MEHSPYDLEAQAESPPLSQASTIADDQTQSRSPVTTSWAVVIQGVDESCTFLKITGEPTDTSKQVWTRIRHHVCSPSRADRFKTWPSMLFSQTVIGTGIIREVPAWDSTQRDSYPRVDLQDYRNDWSLTEAFHNPDISPRGTHSVANTSHFRIEPGLREVKHRPQDVIVIRRVLHKTRIATILILMLFISPGLGSMVGFCTHKAEVGIAVSAGVFALASFLQGLAAWFHVR